MTWELWTLFGAAVLGLVHVSAASFSYKAQVSNAYTVGARDEAIARTGVAGRLDRAHRNFLETFPLFLACVFLVQATDGAGALSQWGGAIYLAGRIAYLPLYALGVPWLRTFAWNIATSGLVLTGAQVLI